MKWSRKILSVTAILAITGAAPLQAAQVQVATSQPDAGASRAKATLLRRVTVAINEPSLERAIRALSTQGKVVLQYQSETLERHTRPVSVQMRNATIQSILEAILSGTSLQIRPLANGQIGIIDTDKAFSTTQSQSSGVVRGVVTDSATKKRLKGVSISVAGYTWSTVTSEDGTFILRNLAPGKYQIVAKLLGYHQSSETVTVQDKSEQTLRFILVPSATLLSGVVTTAVGTQERIKVGNDIARLNVAEILQNAPVTNMSELLTNRVPGLIVQKTSGAPGAPSVIRVRGVSSISLNNDPVIIVDGVRIYSTVTDPADGSPIPGGSAPSPLDGIDPNSVETVEVMRGPSAAALYGTDAANGIIVITTKKGQSGPPRWNFSTQQGITSMPGRYPLFQQLWGKNSIGYNTQCSTVSVSSDRSCVAYDSLVSFQNLNDDRTTVFGRGSVQNYAFDVNGGSQNLQYAFTMSSKKEIGYQKLPNTEIDRIHRLTGLRVPGWQSRPNRSGTVGGTSRVTVQVNPRVDLALTSSVNRQITNTTPLIDVIRGYFKNPQPDDSLITLTQAADFRARGEARRTTARFVLNGGWAIANTLRLSGDMGWDRTDRNEQELLRRGDCPECPVIFKTLDTAGRFNGLRGTLDVISINARGSWQWLDLWHISGPTTFGLNYTQNDNGNVTIKAGRLAAGGNSFSGAEDINVANLTDDRRVAGVYIDQRVGLFKKVYTGFGLRLDAGSGLGRNASLPSFPKLDFSIPIITDENQWHQVSQFRIRTAFGHSGRQPDLTKRLRTFVPQPTLVPGYTTGIGISTIGNTVLRPERSIEFEGGFDIGLWESRFELGVTGYRKMTRDMLINVELPPSVYGGSLQQDRNIGDVLNTGMNAIIMGRIIDGKLIRWNIQGNISSNRNRLIRFSKEMSGSRGSNVLTSGGATGATLNVEGYPLNGFWYRPLLSYADENEDGVLSFEELRFVDSAVYLGGNQPKFDGSFGTTLALFDGRVRMQTSFNYQYGQLKVQEVFANSALSNNTDARMRVLMTHPIANDTLSSLRDRALVVSGAAFMNTLSTLRWNDFSLSVIVPQQVAQLLRAGRMSIALQGNNLRLWSNYSGVDPNVRSRSSETSIDNGQLPPARNWMLRVDLGR